MNASDLYSLPSRHEFKLPEGLPGRWHLCDRAAVDLKPDSVVITNGFFLNTESHGDGRLTFRFRAPDDAPEVQLWAGFRARTRHARYVVALRGGNNNHLYLARLAPEGGSRFLGISPLAFSPVPGVWYELHVVLEGRRIRVFLGDDLEPRMDVEDDKTGWTEGGAVLGGGYLAAEFSHFGFVPACALGPMPPKGPEQGPILRLPGYRHAEFRAISIESLDPVRQEISLDGCWLFRPEYPDGELAGAREKVCDESLWNTIDVPNLWTPFLSWLHGETTFSELSGVSSSKGVNDKVWLSEMARVDSYGFDWNTTRVAWYRHCIVLPEALTGRRFELCFGAVAKACEIWVNGSWAGSHIGMFGEIRCDITRLVAPGQNTIAVQVIRNPEKISNHDKRIVGIAESVEVTTEMTMSLPRDMICHDPAGIWQSVSLIITQPVFVRDVFVRPSLDSASIQLEIGSDDANADTEIRVAFTVRHCETGDILVSIAEALAGSARALGCAQIQLPKVQPLLWHPDSPNLYELEITLFCEGVLMDRHATRFGFRTFETEGNRFLLNGKPYLLRGANHFPHSLRPNDREHARRFIALAREGNVRAARFHVVPLTQAWVEETDRQGLLVSFEGIWPWLMLRGAPPSTALLDIWLKDFLSLVRKYRNHPSLILWTINNEMKFYGFDQKDKALLRRKWKIVTDAIRAVRALDPTRPIVADSGYVRRRQQEDYDTIVRPEGFDDGDVDDVHEYYSWYHGPFSSTYNGEFAAGIASKDRPFICQELSSGYARNDDGLPVRFYLFKHSTPQALVGDLAFEHNDPAHFLDRLALTTKETVEAIRRSTRGTAAGTFSFSYLTWFKDVQNSDLKPWAPYGALKLALQPVLVSAELFGRHFFCGDTLSCSITVANDATDTAPLPPGFVEWEIVSRGGDILAAGQIPVPSVDYYSNARLDGEIRMPDQVGGRCDACLRLRLLAGGKTVSENRYDIVVADRQWAARRDRPGEITMIDAAHVDTLGILDGALSPEEMPAIAVRGACPRIEAALPTLRRYAEAGGRLLFLGSGECLPKMLPNIVKSFRAVNGEIVHAHLPESPVFDALKSGDLAWFHHGRPGISAACSGVFRVESEYPGMYVLAEFIDFHNYLKRPEDIATYSGTPLWACRLGRGVVIASEMSEASAYDPIAARLEANLFSQLAGDHGSSLKSQPQLCSQEPQ